MASLLIRSVASVLAGLVLSCSCTGAAESQSDNYEAFPCYRQELVVEFSDEDSAKQATFAIEPLYDGHYRAVSCRWDDNWTSDNPKTREVMEDFGICGTWYLNGRTFSPEGKPADYAPVARDLLEGGNSVGGHSLTHPYVTYFHSNRIFAEMAGVRIDWEAALDKPVTSYAYSFVDLRPLPEGKKVMLRTLDTLERAGYYHVATYDFFQDVKLRLEYSPITPPENSPFDVWRRLVDWAYDDPGITERHPMISNSMHAWYDTPRLSYGYDELRKRLAYLEDLQDVWHCNQNEYAAYRRQVRLATLSRAKRDGNIVTLYLDRPELISLNDSTPLTLSIGRVAPQNVTAVKCATAVVSESKQSSPNKKMVHVGHDQGQSLPAKIAHIANADNNLDLSPENVDADFPKILGILHEADGHLRLQIRNDSSTPLEDVRIHWRAPIGWKFESQREQAAACGPGQTILLQQHLMEFGPEERRFGTAHFAAQVDFVHAGKPGRIHFTCQRRSDFEADSSFPLDQFALLGPIEKDKFHATAFAERLVREGCPEEWTLEGGSRFNWRPAGRDGYITHAWLNPEYVRTMGTWDHISPTYLLRSRVHSNVEQSAELVLSHDQLCTVFLNGSREETRRMSLREGENELVIIYPGAQMSNETQRLSACFVRLANPESGERLTNIRYQPY